jgi:uncharacterized OsmC-like protein
MDARLPGHVAERDTTGGHETHLGDFALAGKRRWSLPGAVAAVIRNFLQSIARLPEKRMTSKVVSQESFDQPVIRRKSLTAHNEGGMKTVLDFGEAGRGVTDEPVAQGGTGEGPTPLQAVVGALCGCESVTFHRTARELGFQYQGIEFEANFTIDIRGRMGVQGVRPHFQSVRVQARVTTAESEERLRRVVEETERRCPVFNLLSDARVNLEMVWIRQQQGR